MGPEDLPAQTESDRNPWTTRPVILIALGMLAGTAILAFTVLMSGFIGDACSPSSCPGAFAARRVGFWLACSTLAASLVWFRLIPVSRYEWARNGAAWVYAALFGSAIIAYFTMFASIAG